VVLTPPKLEQLEVGPDVIRIPRMYPEHLVLSLELPARMWVEVAGRSLTAPLCTELVVTLSRECDLALARVGKAFNFFVRPQRVEVVTTAHRLIIFSGGEIFSVLRNTLQPPPGLYTADIERYILAWIAAWKISELVDG